ncbi:MAG TPA: hypothetical protein PLQ88_14090, partial [Blastocatellia bacterium]|nr:hypothetical protein [Blastocatellia bacterium]
MKSSLTTRNRSTRIVVVLLIGLMLTTIAAFALRGVSADTLKQFGISEQSRIGQLIKRIAPSAKLSPT